MAASSGNVICVVLAIAFLVIHTFLFTNLSDRLQLSLQRIDDLERLLQNATLQKFTRKTTSKSFLEVLERLLDPELDRDEGHVKSRRLLRKIRHLESRYIILISLLHAIIHDRNIYAPTCSRDFVKMLDTPSVSTSIK